MLDKGSCFSLYHFVPWYLDKNTASSCCVICSSVLEAGGRWREKRECKGKSKARRSAHIGLHQTGDNLSLSVGLERGRTGMCRNDPSKTLFEFSFNPFPLSGWTIPLIFNYMNGGLGSKQSLPISWVLWTERALENVIFLVSVQLPNPIFSLQSLWVLTVHQNSPFSTHHLMTSQQNSGNVSFLITPQLSFLSKSTHSLSYSSRLLLSACLKVGNVVMTLNLIQQSVVKFRVALKARFY